MTILVQHKSNHNLALTDQLISNFSITMRICCNFLMCLFLAGIILAPELSFARFDSFPYCRGVVIFNNGSISQCCGNIGAQNPNTSCKEIGNFQPDAIYSRSDTVLSLSSTTPPTPTTSATCPANQNIMLIYYNSNYTLCRLIQCSLRQDMSGSCDVSNVPCK